MKNKTVHHLVNTLNRVKWPILFGIIALIFLPSNSIVLFLHKTAQLCYAVAFAYLLRIISFPYIDLSDLITQDPRTLQLPEAIRFLGACILVGGFYVAVIYGFTLGL